MRLTRALAALLLFAACSVEDSPTEVEPPLAMSTVEWSPSGFAADPYAPDFLITAGTWSLADRFFPSNGDGTFGNYTLIDIDIVPGISGVDVADFDGDGDNDFMGCERNETNATTPGGAVYLYTNDGNGVFKASVVASPVTMSLCTNLREGDFDGDGLIDFVVGEYSGREGEGMFVYRQTPSGSFEKVIPGLDMDWIGLVFGVATGDVDGDHHEDILVLIHSGTHAGEVRFYKGDGTGAMAASKVLFNILDIPYPTGLGLFDFEGDGDLDIVAGGGNDGAFGAGQHYIYTNDGFGNFSPPDGPAFDVGMQSGLDAFDFDGDGDHDLVGVRGGNLFYVENLGGSLASPQYLEYLRNPTLGIGAPPLPASNAPPVADAGGPYIGAVNTPIAFDGSGSADPDGDVLTFDWTPNVFGEAGIYDVCLTVTDTGGLSDTACTFAVVYDPSAGFVTGGGWIDSPLGAYVPDPSLAGKATFGFVARYKKGATVPTGNTEFQFRTADLDFHSSSYEWLVVNQGGSNAQFRGFGTINGEGSYRFMLWAQDDPDTFRIRIWVENEATGVETVIYDNGDGGTMLGGGSIVIHTN